MTCKYDTVIYQEKEYKAIEIIKQLDLSLASYYKSRNKGKSPQEAFDHCQIVKDKQEKRKDKNVLQIASNSHVSKKVIYNAIYQEKDVNNVITIQQEKKEENRCYLENLYKKGLPKDYDSLNEFCKINGLNLKVIRYNIDEKGMNLYEAIKNSFNQNVRKSKYMFFNIQLKSFLQKYNLNYDTVIFYLKQGSSYLSAIERGVFASIFSENIGGRLNYLWNIYQNDFLNGNSTNLITESEYIHFMECKIKMAEIKRDCLYYEYLTSISIDEYQLLTLDDRVYNILISEEKLPFTLSELYYLLDFENGFMKEFNYIKKSACWIYKGNQEVLSRIQKRG